MMESFTQEQRGYLLDTWKKDDFDWLYDIGTRIYSKIFELAPSAKVLFPYVMQCEQKGENWTESKEFQNQALRFVQALGGGIECLEEPGETKQFEDRLYQLGKLHRKYKDRGFFPEYWNVFEVAVREVMKEEAGKKGEVKEKDVYAKLANYIIEQMRKGFEDADH